MSEQKHWDSIPEVPGPKGWPELKWAARTLDGTWFCCQHRPTGHSKGYLAQGVRIHQYSLGWEPPPEIANLPPGKGSLVRLTHDHDEDTIDRVEADAMTEPSFDIHITQFRLFGEAKKQLEAQLHIPRGFRWTGEFRPPKYEEWYLGADWVAVHNETSMPSPRLILEPISLEGDEAISINEGKAIRMTDGPADWPALKWAAKNIANLWFLSDKEPKLERQAYVSTGVSLLADEIGWEPPADIANLAPHHSLVALRHEHASTRECQWTFRDGEWLPGCANCYWKLRPKYCPECGHKTTESRNA